MEVIRDDDWSKRMIILGLNPFLDETRQKPSCGWDGFPLDTIKEAINPPTSPWSDAQNTSKLPSDLELMLVLGNIKGAEDYLQRIMFQETDPRYLWIRELLEIEYSTPEVAELLREQSVDSPWIYFDQSQLSCSEIKEDWHIPGCPHTKCEPQDITNSTMEPEHGLSSQQTEIKNLVEGLCGIGGVAPSSRKEDEWIGSIMFDSHKSCQHVRVSYDYSAPVNISTGLLSYGSMFSNPDSEENGVLRLSKALDNIHCAASLLQKHQLCCDSFSILVRRFNANHPELVRIPFSWIAKLRAAIFGDWTLWRSDGAKVLSDCENCTRSYQECDGGRPCRRCLRFQETCPSIRGASLSPIFEDHPEPQATIAESSIQPDRKNLTAIDPGYQNKQQLPHSSYTPIFGRSKRLDWFAGLSSKKGVRFKDGAYRATKRVGRVAREFLLHLELCQESQESATETYFSDACLAAQVLATGLLSYLQAHVGPLKPFFLDKDVERISLYGSRPLGLFQPRIILEPFKMTCMDQMLQGSALVFQRYGPLASERRLNLLATAEDLLDTWGPGCYIKLRRPAGSRTCHPGICGVRIGGGTIMRSPGQGGLYHFYPTTVSLPSDVGYEPIFPDQHLLIGAPISVNGSCTNDEGMRYRQCDPFLVNLGTHPSIWEASQRQLAIQGGQYLVPQFAQTWNKTPGATIKKCQLSQQSPLTTPFLESFWGMQVSFCTGIARRVRMRELLADIVGIHVHNQLRVSPEWSQLEQEDVIKALYNEPDLQAWLGQRSEEQQAYLEKVIRQILEGLGPTGVDCTGNLTIAWMRPNKEPRCLRIPCERESAWAKILTDSADCATYAYFTSKCLATDKIQCQGPDSIWHRRSSLLSTAVSPHQAFAGATTVQSTFQLEDRRFYYLGDSNLVQAQALGPNETRLLFQRTSIAPQVFRRMRQKARCNRIRERQDNDSPARPVLVLTAER